VADTLGDQLGIALTERAEVRMTSVSTLRSISPLHDALRAQNSGYFDLLRAALLSLPVTQDFGQAKQWRPVKKSCLPPRRVR
jgi:hypothetical protein